MKNLQFLALSFIFISLCAFQCEGDGCDILDDHRDNIDIELSSIESSYSVNDKITISSNFSSTIASQFSDLDYSITGQRMDYEFEVFEVQENNQPVKAVGDKIDVNSVTSEPLFDGEDISNEIRFNCEGNCSFDFTLTLNEPGYYGVVFKTGNFVSMDDCVVVTVTGEKPAIQNIDILNEIGTQTISYSISDSPVVISPTNSFFFKVE